MNQKATTSNGSRHRGFTFLELILVVVILAVLAGLLLPSLIASKRKADRTQNANNAREAQTILAAESNEPVAMLGEENKRSQYLSVSNTNSDATSATAPQPDFERIDAHIHIYKIEPLFRDLLNRLNFRVLDICVVDNFNPDFPKLAFQEARARELSDLTGGRVAWCAGFDPTGWEEPGYADKIIEQLKIAFEQGAVAVKIYKDIGMLQQAKDGSYLMPDNPVFDPIFEFIGKNNRTIYNHIADPWDCWRPPKTNGLYNRYYSITPAEYMYLHPERPAKETILAARDRMVKNHPNVRFVCCHLGALDEDVDFMAQRFDLYPNFAVDTAGWMKDLMNQDSDKVRAFLIKYQDRVLYATDRGLEDSDNSTNMLAGLEAAYDRDWKYFSGSEHVRYGRLNPKGLALPHSVLQKILRDNALKWVPGIIPEK